MVSFRTRTTPRAFSVAPAYGRHRYHPAKGSGWLRSLTIANHYHPAKGSFARFPSGASLNATMQFTLLPSELGQNLSFSGADCALTNVFLQLLKNFVRGLRMGRQTKRTPDWCPFCLAPQVGLEPRPGQQAQLLPGSTKNNHRLFFYRSAPFARSLRSLVAGSLVRGGQRGGRQTKRTPNRCPFCLAPQVGLEPTTLRLTAACSTG